MIYFLFKICKNFNYFLIDKARYVILAYTY